MAKISITTANKQAITRTVTSSLRSHLDELATGVAAILHPEARPGDSPVSAYQTALHALADTLDRDFGALSTADREVARELGEDQQARVRRDRCTEDLRESLQQIRSLVVMAYGSEQIAGLGLAGRLPDQVEALIPVARNVAEKLGALARFEGPGESPEFVRFDVAVAAAALTRKAQALDDALTDLARDIRETQAVQSLHSSANATWQRHYVPIARIIEGFFLLAGMDHQAERVRPTQRRRVGRPEAGDLDNTAPAADPDASDERFGDDSDVAAAS